jgi:predicted dehydrogenase
VTVSQILIVGAGSIGNHMAHAARSLGWAVTMSDRDSQALQRTRDQIYPMRYGNWDDEITLAESFPTEGQEFDLVVIGTPPASHLPLAIEALRFNPEGILIEKPLSSPGYAHRARDLKMLDSSRSRIFVGYNHVVAESMSFFVEIARSGSIGEPTRLSVEILEHWGGIFQAHPWLSGPEDSYLGSWQEGGGSLSEHSHGLNMWQHIARELGGGEVVEARSQLTMRSILGREYDESFNAYLRTEAGLEGTCSQDVVTSPSKKVASIEASRGTATLEFSPTLDRVSWSTNRGTIETRDFSKSRPMDFIAELRHLDGVLMTGSPSPLDLKWGDRTGELISKIVNSAEIVHSK